MTCGNTVDLSGTGYLSPVCIEPKGHSGEHTDGFITWHNDADSVEGTVTVTEWGVRLAPGWGYRRCVDEEHAETLMRSPSPDLGPKESRVIVSREITTTPWKERT